MCHNGRMILGIDEVGRGPWAGPLVVAAVVLPDGLSLEYLNDSKKVTKKRRIVLEAAIKKEALGYGIGWVSSDELDQIGMAEALRRAARQAVEQVTCSYHEIIIDGSINFLTGTEKGRYVTTMPKADALVPSVSAASILAKVARDRFMIAQDTVYPGYGFASHVGYGTAMHRQAIQDLGVTPLHRLSFRPLAGYAPVKPKDYTIGFQAETIASLYLEQHGHTILERNWRTKFCEIDIISRQQDTIYIVEVKHRTSDAQGGGIEAIDRQKLHKLQLGARAYVQAKLPREPEIVKLAVVSTTGTSPMVSSYLEVE